MMGLDNMTKYTYEWKADKVTDNKAILWTLSKAVAKHKSTWSIRNDLNPLSYYTAGGFVWCDMPFYLVKQSQEKWACDFRDDALPLSFQLQVAEVIF